MKKANKLLSRKMSEKSMKAVTYGMLSFMMADVCFLIASVGHELYSTGNKFFHGYTAQRKDLGFRGKI